MAKTRHQKLHVQITLMATNMNYFFNKLYWVLCQVPRNDYWKYGKTDVCLLSQRIQKLIALVDYAAHTVFTFCHILAKSNDFKSNTRASQAIGISRTPHKKRNADFAQKSFYQALLFCCDESELGTHTWFKEDEACDSFSHQLNSIAAVWHEDFVRNGNLERHPYPIFQDAVYAWNANSDRLSKIDSKLNAAILLHEPPAVSTVFLAWKYVKKILHEGKNRRVEKFLKLYLSMLEEVIFHQIPWSNQQKQCWLSQQEDELLKNSTPKPIPSTGRWQQGNSVDYTKAAKLLLYFVENFLKNPNDFKSAEIACILWLMLWCAFHHLTDIKENDIINLTTDNFLNHGKLKLRENIFEVSQGLQKLLAILFGGGQGVRAHRIFKNVTNQKMLTRALEEASKLVLGPNEVVTPSAFLNFPHMWPGTHLSRRVREAMRSARHIIEPKLPEKYIVEAKKILSNIATTFSIRK